MTSKHSLISPNSDRARCPVCNQAVYSKAGIHPQCAVRQAELQRTKPDPGEPQDQVPEL